MIAVALAGALFTAGPANAVPSPARGSVNVIAHVLSPGFPALAKVVGNDIYEGTYTNPNGDALPSKVLEFNSSGTLLHSWTVAGQDLSQPHGVQVAATDALGRLILLDRTSGRIIQLNPRTGAQDIYARVPDLAICSAAKAGQPCSPAMIDEPPMPDYAAWGPDGSLYVTDYQQAVIWRIPPHGGSASIWLADRRLDGTWDLNAISPSFGTAGIVLEPSHHAFLFDQASNVGLGGADPGTGKLYSAAIEPNGRPGPLHQLWESRDADLPDGFALAASGDIYMALVGLANQVVELSPTGKELTRFGDYLSGSNGSSIPFDSPSGGTFLGTEFVLANQSALAGDAANQAVLGLQTGERGASIFVPANAGLRPGERIKHKKHKKHKLQHKRHKRKHRHRKHKR
jgi:hypothetical protein